MSFVFDTFVSFSWYVCGKPQTSINTFWNLRQVLLLLFDFKYLPPTLNHVNQDPIYSFLNITNRICLLLTKDVHKHKKLAKKRFFSIFETMLTFKAIVFDTFVSFSLCVYGKSWNVNKDFLKLKSGTLSVDCPLPQTSDHMNQEPIY